MYLKTLEVSVLKYTSLILQNFFLLKISNLYGRAMPQKLPVDNFEGIKDTSQYNEDLIKSYNGENNEGYFLDVDSQFLEKLH